MCPVSGLGFLHSFQSDRDSPPIVVGTTQLFIHPSPRSFHHNRDGSFLPAIFVFFHVSAHRFFRKAEKGGNSSIDRWGFLIYLFRGTLYCGLALSLLLEEENLSSDCNATRNKKSARLIRFKKAPFLPPPAPQRRTEKAPSRQDVVAPYQLDHI